MCGDGGVVRFPSISEPSVLSVLDVHPAPLRGGWTSRAIRTLTQAVASRSQCRQLRHQTTSSRYRTTRPAYPLVTPVSTRKALRRLGGDRSVKRHLRQGTSTSRLRRGAAGSSTACLRGGDWRVASEDTDRGHAERRKASDIDRARLGSCCHGCALGLHRANHSLFAAA